MPINWLLKIFNKSNQGSDSYMEVATEFVYFDNKTHSFPRFNRNSKVVELTKLKSVSCKNLKEMERNPEK